MQYMSQLPSGGLCADSFSIGNTTWDGLELGETRMRNDNLELAYDPAPNVLCEFRFKANHGEGRANRP